MYYIVKMSSVVPVVSVGPVEPGGPVDPDMQSGPLLPVVNPVIITDDNIRDLIKLYLTNSTDLPDDLKGVPLNNWDVSRVTNMTRLFADLPTFNEPLNNWNVRR